MGAAASVQKENVYGKGTVSIAELVSTTRTGDLLFFRGNSWTSTLERWWLWCDYTHVGMVEWRRLPGDEFDTACLWESVGHLDRHPCLLRNRRTVGTRLVRLADRLADYIHDSNWDDTPVCLLQLESHSAAATEHMQRRVRLFIDQTYGESYTTSLVNLFRSQAPEFAGAAPMGHRAGYTCNQLVVRTLVFMDAYSTATPLERITLTGLLRGDLLHEWEFRGALSHTNYHFNVRSPSASHV